MTRTTSRLTSTVLLPSHHNEFKEKAKKWPHLKVEIASEVLNSSLRTCNRDH